MTQALYAHINKKKKTFEKFWPRREGLSYPKYLFCPHFPPQPSPLAKTNVNNCLLTEFLL
jgi:hypothetical protein